MRTRQQGLTTVEFSIIGTLFFIVLFAVIEFGRMLFVWNTLTEATRRGARVAVVCPPGHVAIARIAVFNDPGTSGASPVVNGLDPADVVVEYLDQAGVLVATPAANPEKVEYVRVRISGYQHSLLIPLFNRLFTDADIPDFETTLPRESLGAVPDPKTGAVSSECF